MKASTDKPANFPGVAVLAFLCLCSSLSAGAAQRTYEIELLVFRNLIQNDGGEVWEADYADWFDSAAAATPAPLTAHDVQWLSQSDWRLARHEAALRASADYRPIAHFAWRQTVLDRKQAGAVQLPATGRKGDDAWVDGSVRVAVERYLHLNLDLQLHLPRSGGETGGELEAYREPRFKLTQQRRMRSRELHYFDNPRFGVLALITPYDVPADASSEPAATPADTAP